MRWALSAAWVYYIVHLRWAKLCTSPYMEATVFTGILPLGGGICVHNTGKLLLVGDNCNYNTDLLYHAGILTACGHVVFDQAWK